VQTPAGHALFKVLNEGAVSKADGKDLAANFDTVEGANSMVKLKAFMKFEDTTEALASTTALLESKLDKGLKGFLKKNILKKDLKDELAVAETKIGGVIKEKMGIPCIHNASIFELIRGVRSQITNLITGIDMADYTQMSLGLAHSLSRYKLKFSPDKVDVMIIQAIGLLDDLDKELNTYAMRSKEWYGWHFPEMAKIVNDNVMFAKVVKKMGTREKAATLDFSDILPDDVEEQMKEAAIVSMGTEISEEDVDHIHALCDQVISLSEYRVQLFDYLKNRMAAIAPNLTILVGELVGARLISHAGSLLNLAKHPASTVQILGAEKALFRALKTKHETPKYGLIYHASLVGSSAPKFKGKISRVLASKCSLAIRYDALSESDDASVGLDGRAKVEARLRQLEGGSMHVAAAPTGAAKIQKYEGNGTTASYNPASDSTLGEEKKSKKEKKVSEIASRAHISHIAVLRLRAQPVCVMRARSLPEPTVAAAARAGEEGEEAESGRRGCR
jgi:nucleolar protein 58